MVAESENFYVEVEEKLKEVNYTLIDWSIEINNYRTATPYTQFEKVNDEYYNSEDLSQCLLKCNRCPCSSHDSTQRLRARSFLRNRIPGVFDQRHNLCNKKEYKNLDSLHQHCLSKLTIPQKRRQEFSLLDMTTYFPQNLYHLTGNISQVTHVFTFYLCKFYLWYSYMIGA